MKAIVIHFNLMLFVYQYSANDVFSCIALHSFVMKVVTTGFVLVEKSLKYFGEAVSVGLFCARILVLNSQIL